MELFGTVLIVVVLVAIVVAALSYIGSGSIYRGLGRTGLALDEPDLRPGPPPGSAAANAEAREEIRQMLEAKSARMEARGEAPLDIDAEIGGAAWPRQVWTTGLREEVRAAGGGPQRAPDAPRRGAAGRRGGGRTPDCAS